MSNTETTTTNAPTHIAYHIREVKEKRYWNRIGVVWAHKDGDGFNIDFDCTPINGKVTVRVASEKK